MARGIRLYFSIAVILVSALRLLASPPPPVLDTNPRHLDGRHLGHSVLLGPDWLFSADDNPANAATYCDDSGWKVISSDQPCPLP